MSDKIAVKVDHLSKTFKLPKERNNSVKGAVVNFYKRDRGYEMQEALKDISFEVKEGEFFGIVGRNGSGKSTLLKILAGIYYPSTGKVDFEGKLTPFIELGVGFSMELTGRENVFLNGALLGFSRPEMEALYDDIVAFAELERFMDQKLKNYSSGMQVRLAFSIAIRVNSDVLLIDEVLAVGDSNFQNKCINVFRQLKAEKKTILFISHDMGMIRRFCDRALMIKEGEIVASGTPDDIAELYEEANMPSESERRSAKALNREIGTRSTKIITHLNLMNDKLKESQIFDSGEEAILSIKLKAGSPAKNIGVAVYSKDNQYVFGTNTINDSVKIGTTIKYKIKLNLGEGEYKFKIGVFGKTDATIYEFFESGPAFYIRSDEQNKSGWQGTVYLDHKWS